MIIVCKYLTLTWDFSNFACITTQTYTYIQKSTSKWLVRLAHSSNVVPGKYYIFLDLLFYELGSLAVSFLLLYMPLHSGTLQQPRPANLPVKWPSYQLGIDVSMCSAVATFADKAIYLSLSDGWGRSVWVTLLLQPRDNRWGGDPNPSLRLAPAEFYAPRKRSLKPSSTSGDDRACSLVD